MSDVQQLRVLVVEDDHDTRENLCDILSLDGHTFDIAGTAAEALDRDNWSVYHAILLDWRLPDSNAEMLLPRLRELAPDAAVIVSTAVGGIDHAIAALRHGAADYIAKPVDADLLRASLRRIAQQLQLRAQKDLSEAAFRTLVEAAGSMIVILDLDGAITYVNPFGEQLTGYSTGELQQRNCIDALVPPIARESAELHLSGVIAGRVEHGLELPVRDRAGALHWLLWNCQRLDDFKGQPAILAIGQDVTARRQAEQKLLQAERLAAIGQAMTGLAHESRNALQRGQADLELLALLVEELPEAVILVRRLQGVQQELHRLYEEVRQYAAPIGLALETCRLERIAREAWELLEPARSGRRAELQINGGAHSDCRVDRFQMLQVFRNLFENSLGAQPDSVCVTVTFEVRRIDGDQRLIAVVSDNGPGIPSDVADSVLEPFFTTKTRGTGLGLAIVRRIVEAHHGRIRLGAPHTGAQFVLELPV